MKENEFDVMDQLYFVVSFQELKEATGFEAKIIEAILWQFLAKGWVKCLINPEEEVSVTKEAFDNDFDKYYYLASKVGLLEHNLR